MRKTYSLPEIYDIAFGFRDVPAEVDFLCETTQKHLGRRMESAMELACGPAYHTREMARRNLIAHGLDLEPAMVTYTRQLAAQELLAAEIYQGDMRTFTGARTYDLVYILMASFAQLETNQDILDNLNCAAELLSDGGIYIICTAHPRDFYGDEKKSAETHWTMTRGDSTVETSWGGENQQFDPLTEVDDIVVSFTVTTPEGTIRHDFPDRYRRCSMMTFQALVQLSGRFRIVEMYGALDSTLKLSNDPRCWRFVPVLKKIR